MTANVQFEVTPELQLSMEKFSTFYQARHNGRRLAYLLQNSRGEVATSCFNRRYTFVVS
jgi:hypothetical protein